MKRVTKRLLPILILVVIGIVVRIIYAFNFPEIISGPDGHEYYKLAVSFLEKRDMNILISPYRPPLYSIFTAFLIIFSGRPNHPLDFAGFPVLMNYIVFFQSLLAIAGVILVYFVFKRLKLPETLSFIGALILNLNMTLIPYERVYLTESLSVFWMILFAWVFLILFKTADLKSALFYLLISVSGILIKVALLPIPVLGLILIAFKNRSPKSLAVYFITGFLFISIPFLWIRHNQSQYGIPKFSVYSSINLLGRIINHRLPPELDEDTIDFYNQIQTTYKSPVPQNPYQFLSALDPYYFKNLHIFAELDKFNLQMISGSKIRFISGIISDLPLNFTRLNPLTVHRINPANSFWANFFSAVQYLYRILGLIFILFIPVSFILFFVSIIKKINNHLYTAISLGVMASVFVITNTIFGYEDFSRLSTPAIPILFISLWGLAFKKNDFLK